MSFNLNAFCWPVFSSLAHGAYMYLLEDGILVVSIPFFSVSHWLLAGLLGKLFILLSTRYFDERRDQRLPSLSINAF